MNPKFANLHNHSEYSLLDGKSKIKDMVKRAKELGQEALGIMDHGNTFGHVSFYKECNKVGIKPILGYEAYMVVELMGDDGKKKREFSHMSIIAMNNKGLQNINKLTRLASEQFYYKPRITIENLIEHNEGLIILSGCFASLISQWALKDEDDKAIELIKKFKESFGDRFYIEVQDSGVPGQDKVVRKLRKWAKDYDVKPVVTNDSHYVDQDDAFHHSVLLAINTRSKMTDKPTYEGGRRFAFSTDEYYMKDTAKLLEEGWTPDEINNTWEIAERCSITIDCTPRVPIYPFVPEGMSSIEHLRNLCRKAWVDKKIGDRTEYDYHGRILYELQEIEDCDLADYFLIVQHYVKWARENGIPTGAGRGSAVGSLVSYMLGITTIDPMPFGLYWERFWNKGRAGVGMPDIDSDFSQDKRQDVLSFIKETFGEDRVLPVISFGKMAIKGVLKDVGRTLGIDHDITNHITNFVPNKVDTLDEALSKSPDLQKFKEKYKKLFSISERLQNTVKNASIHPSALVILDKRVEEGSIPISWDTKGKQIITGYDMHTLDDVGLLKADILGLKNLDILDITNNLATEDCGGNKGS